MHKYLFIKTVILIFLCSACRLNSQSVVDLNPQKQLQELTLLEMFVNSEYYGSEKLYVIVDSVERYAGIYVDLNNYINDSTEIATLVELNEKEINFVIDYKLDISLDYQLIRKEETNDLLDFSKRSIFWENFYKIYPNSIGFIEFSAFRLSNSGKYAIGEYLHLCGSRCGSVVEIIFELIDAKWKLIHEETIVEF